MKIAMNRALLPAVFGALLASPALGGAGAGAGFKGGAKLAPRLAVAYSNAGLAGAGEMTILDDGTVLYVEKRRFGRRTVIGRIDPREVADLSAAVDRLPAARPLAVPILPRADRKVTLAAAGVGTRKLRLSTADAAARPVLRRLDELASMARRGQLVPILPATKGTVE